MYGGRCYHETLLLKIITWTWRYQLVRWVSVTAGIGDEPAKEG